MMLLDGLAYAAVGLAERDHRHRLGEVGVGRRAGEEPQILIAGVARQAPGIEPGAVAAAATKELGLVEVPERDRRPTGAADGDVCRIRAHAALDPGHRLAAVPVALAVGEPAPVDVLEVAARAGRDEANRVDGAPPAFPLVGELAALGDVEVAVLDHAPALLGTGRPGLGAALGGTIRLHVVCGEPRREDHDVDARRPLILAILVVDGRLPQTVKGRAELVAELLPQERHEAVLLDRLPIGVAPALQASHHDGVFGQIEHCARPIGQQQLAEALGDVGHVGISSRMLRRRGFGASGARPAPCPASIAPPRTRSCYR